MNYIETFQLSLCPKVTLEYYEKASDIRDGNSPIRKKEISNESIISEIFSLLNQLPDAGDMMVKMGDVPVIQAKLHYTEKEYYFTFYMEKIKTPATSFFSEPLKEEALLHELLETILNV